MSFGYSAGVLLAKVSLREDGNRLKPNDWQLIAEQSALHFSKDRPRKMLADITGNGTKVYTLTGTITGWVNRFSYFKKSNIQSIVIQKFIFKAITIRFMNRQQIDRKSVV